MSPRWCRPLTLLASAAAVATLGACTSIAVYAGHYRKLGDATGPGVMPAAQLLQMLDETRADRALVCGSEELAASHARCLFFRNQLVVAAEKARLDPAPTASKVQRAAERMERAFQDSDEVFLATCTHELDSELGKAFAAEIAAAGLE